ncbi:MAG TPA: hypothetical protein PKY50_06180 [Candidatus Competibacter sp.]|nr:hypothetical protein [Candidatus Competibacter sp.]
MSLNSGPFNAAPLNSTATGSQPGPTAQAMEHDAAWNTFWATSHETAWTALQAQATEHDAAWTVSTALEHDAAWTATLGAEHDTSWSVVAVVAMAMEHDAAWTAWQAQATEHDATWTAWQAQATEHDATWTAIDPHAFSAEHAAAWTVLDLSAVVSALSPALSVGVRRVAFATVSLTASEQSPFWQADIELLVPADYCLFQRDAEFDVDLFGTTFRFLVDSRELTRRIDDDGNVEAVATVTGLSPVCRHAEPRALAIDRTWDQPATARSIVEDLLEQTVDWQMVDWWIPANRLAASGAYPLDIARQIIEAAGGWLESKPDGSLLARPAWPVSVPDLSPGTTDWVLDDRIVFAVEDRPSVDATVNRVRIVDVEGNYRDALEFVADDDDTLSGELRAYPSPWRSGLTLRHTRGSPPVYLGAGAGAAAQQTETVEFVAGKASVRYPVVAIQSIHWLANDLGGVAHDPWSTELVSSADGYSLAEVTYTTRYVRASVRATEPTAAQFLLEDAWLE